MTTMASKITSLTVVYSTIFSDADQRKHQSSASLAFVWGIQRDRWTAHTKGQLRGKCFHLMTSSWYGSCMPIKIAESLQWRHNGCDSVSNHQPHNCLLNHLFRRRSKKTPKLRVTGLCEENSPGTGEFPAKMASNAENVSIWWRLHVTYAADPLYLQERCFGINHFASVRCPWRALGSYYL